MNLHVLHVVLILGLSESDRFRLSLSADDLVGNKSQVIYCKGKVYTVYRVLSMVRRCLSCIYTIPSSSKRYCCVHGQIRDVFGQPTGPNCNKQRLFVVTKIVSPTVTKIILTQFNKRVPIRFTLTYQNSSK